jgi:hypothetical protein
LCQNLFPRHAHSLDRFWPVVERQALDLVDAPDGANSAIGCAETSGWPVGAGEPPPNGFVCYGCHVARRRFPAKAAAANMRKRHG